jgi:hypothetical protein
LKPSQPPSTREAGAVACDLTAFGRVRVAADGLPELRRKPGPVCGDPLPASFLKHADEQTVAGLAAVYQAIHDHGLGDTCFTDWGVLAAPCHQGRAALAGALLRFKAEGAWGVSPHLIPHRSLHSLSGAVSLALRIHGPNFGVGGGPGAAREVLPAAVALLARKQLPGIWVVLSTLSEEPAPTPQGDPSPGSVWVGQALALRPAQSDWTGIRLQLGRGLSQPEGPIPVFDPFHLHDALEKLSAKPEPGLTLALALDGGLRVALSRAATEGGHPAGLNGSATNGHYPSNHHHGNGHAVLHPPHANGVNGKAHHPASVSGRRGVETQP